MASHAAPDVLNDQVVCNVYSTSAATGSNYHSMSIVHVQSGVTVEHSWHDDDRLRETAVYEDLMNLLQRKVYPDG